MRVDRLWVPGPLWNLNDIVALRASKYRGAYSREKRKHEATVAQAVRDCGVLPWAVPVHMHYELVESSRRRDPSNAMAGASKVIEDGLQAAGVLSGDGWQHIAGISVEWRVDKAKPGVLVTLSEARRVA